MVVNHKLHNISQHRKNVQTTLEYERWVVRYQELLFLVLKSLKSKIDEDPILVKSKDKEGPIKVEGCFEKVKVYTSSQKYN
jgi:hypothetical protein